jgi:protein-S-isoprenylcysteine O-methyltransferase
LNRFRPSVTDLIRKVAQGALICSVLLVVIWLVWPEALHFPQIWMLALTSLLANVLQPSYNPFRGASKSADHGTALQIVWTIYAAQVLNVAEFLLSRPRLELDVWSWLFFALMLAGLALRTWAVATLGQWFTWHVEVQTNQRLVIAGPYRFVRHPSYTGAFVTFVSACALLHSWIAAAIAAILLGFAFARRIRYEERLLKDAMPEYAEYARSTGAMVPKLP